MFKKVLVLFLLLHGIILYANNDPKEILITVQYKKEKHQFTRAQIELVNMILIEAKKKPNKFGETFGKTLVYIALAESSLGNNLIGDFKVDVPITKASLGNFQFQVLTIKDLAWAFNDLKWLRDKSEQWIANKLLKDKDFQMEMALWNIKRLSETDFRKDSWEKIVSGWNGGVWNKKYLQNIYKYRSIALVLLKKMDELGLLAVPLEEI